MNLDIRFDFQRRERLGLIEAIWGQNKSIYQLKRLSENVLDKKARNIGHHLWTIGDVKTIDNWIVNGTAYRIGNIANRIKVIQSGYIYHYALMMILGLAIFLGWTILNSGVSS